MKNYLEIVYQRISWSRVGPDEQLYWREKVLLAGYLITLFFGGPVFFGLDLPRHLAAGNYGTAALGTASILLAAAVVASRGYFSYKTRASLTVAIVYLLAVFTTLEIGSVVVGFVEMAFVPVMVAVFFGLRSTLFAIAILAVTLLAIGVGLSSQLWPIAFIQAAGDRFPIWSAWLFVWSVAISLSVSIMHKGLATLYLKEKALSNSLEAIVVRRTESLEKANESLKEEILQRKATEKEKEKTIRELQAAMEQIKELREMIPICSHCKKIRDDDGYWGRLESYFADNYEMMFTHSLCPDCIKELYPEFADRE